MFNSLYLLHDPDRDWWQLRVEDRYYCLSCGVGEEHIKNCIRHFVKKYKTEGRLLAALDDLDSGGVVRNEVELVIQKDLYKVQGHMYKDLIQRVVKETMQEMKEDRPIAKTLKTFKKMVLPTFLVETSKEIIEETKTPVVSTPRVTKPIIKPGIKRLQLNID